MNWVIIFHLWTQLQQLLRNQYSYNLKPIVVMNEWCSGSTVLTVSYVPSD